MFTAKFDVNKFWQKHTVFEYPRLWTQERLQKRLLFASSIHSIVK